MCGVGPELASLALCHPQGTLPACLEPRPDPGRAVEAEAVPRHDKPIPVLSPSPAHGHTCTYYPAPHCLII